MVNSIGQYLDKKNSVTSLLCNLIANRFIAVFGEKSEDTKWVTKSSKSQNDRQGNDKKEKENGQKEKQWSTQHYTEN